MPSCLRYAGIVFLLAAALVMVVSFATPNWIAGMDKAHPNRELRYGLWHSCVNIRCFSIFSNTEGMVGALGDWLYLAQALCVVGMVTCGLAAVLSATVVLYDQCRNASNTIGVITLLVILSCVTYSTGVATYGIKSDEKAPIALAGPLTFGFSFYMGIASCITMCISFIFYILEYRHLTATRIKYHTING